VTFLRRKPIQGLWHNANVSLQDRVGVSLEVSQAGLAFFEALELISSDLADLLEVGELLPELVEGD
jgi:hypothetical protein